GEGALGSPAPNRRDRIRRRRALPPLVGSTRRLPEELLLCRGRAFGRVLDSGGRRRGPAALARTRLCSGGRLRGCRRNLAHGGRRPFLYRLDLRRRVQLSGDLA